jgi:hypothetical protein
MPTPRQPVINPVLITYIYYSFTENYIGKMASFLPYTRPESLLKVRLRRSPREPTLRKSTRVSLPHRTHAHPHCASCKLTDATGFVIHVYRRCDVRHRTDTLSYPIAVRHFTKQTSYELISSVDGPSPMKTICVLLVFAHTFSCFHSGKCFQMINSNLRVTSLLVCGLLMVHNL